MLDNGRSIPGYHGMILSNGVAKVALLCKLGLRLVCDPSFSLPDRIHYLGAKLILSMNCSKITKEDMLT